MRILVLVHEFPPVGGGGGRVAEDICTKLARRGHEVKVLTTHIKGLPHQEERNGFQVVRVGSLRRQPYRASLLSMAVYVLAGLWAGLRLIGSFKPHVIHGHFAVPAGALAWMLSRLTRIPYVLTVHLGDIPGGVPEKTDEWFRWIYPLTPPIWRDAREIIAVSEFTRQLALKKYKEKIQVIPNGADLSALMPKGLALNDPPRIVFAGRFMEQKNPLQFVQALNRGSARAELHLGEYRGYASTLNEDVMAELAEGSGGTFFHNSNDLEGGLQRLTVVPEWVYLMNRQKPPDPLPTVRAGLGRGWIADFLAPTPRDGESIEEGLARIRAAGPATATARATAPPCACPSTPTAPRTRSSSALRCPALSRRTSRSRSKGTP